MVHIERPVGLKAVLEALAQPDTGALAGGTNVMVDIKKKREKRRRFVSIDTLDELKKIEEKEDGIHIGSLAVFSEIEDHFKDRSPAYACLCQAVSHVGGPQIRNRGTIGGNILCASPSSDTVPALLVLDASLKLLQWNEKDQSVKERIVALEGFVTGVRCTALAPGELLTEIILPKKKGISCFYKAGPRKAMAISVVNGALYLERGEDGRIQHAGVAMGAVSPAVTRAHDTEKRIEGQTTEAILQPDVMEGLRESLSREITPISDIRAGKDYRYLTAENILEENLKFLLGGAR